MPDPIKMADGSEIRPFPSPLVTDAMLDTLETAERFATPGPWYAHNPDDRFSMNIVCVTADPIEPDDESGLRSAVCATLLQTPGVVGRDNGRWDQDAEFIALSRAAVPLLVDEVRRLRRENAALRELARDAGTVTETRVDPTH